MPSLTFDTYGKTHVRLTQLRRNGTRHELVELSAKILFRGDFTGSFTRADNSQILPTDTMKNTVYALARLHPVTVIEEFARLLAHHFLDTVAQLEQVEVELSQLPWSRIEDHDSAFVLGGREHRIARVISTKHSEQITSGVSGLEIIKTGKSAFSAFMKDRWTTLQETRDRLLGTVLDATWTYRSAPSDYTSTCEHVRSCLLRAFAEHTSESVQHTLFYMAQSALRSYNALQEVHLVMPNKHRLLVDLTRFGLNNPNEIFVATDEPSGYIEARVSAD
jgi:urate oxidase